MTDLGPINPQSRSGGEPIGGLGAVLDLWRWSASDLLSNATRGVLAEFIVGRALRAESKIRSEWDPYDLTTPDGITVEVKSSACIQGWHQDEPSRVSFGIAPARAWGSETNSLAGKVKRLANL